MRLSLGKYGSCLFQIKMGARQSKRSVDITTTPKKGAEDVATEGEGKVEKIAEITTNGAIHNEIEYAVRIFFIYLRGATLVNCCHAIHMGN